MKRLCIILFILFAASALGVYTLGGDLLRRVQTIPLHNVQGRIDHMAINLKSRHLFVVALGNNSVEVLDLHAGKQIHRIGGLNEPQGVLYIPELNRIFVANGGDGSCNIFDGTSFHMVDRLKFSNDADNVRYDTITRHVYVGYGNGGLGVIDSNNWKRIGNIQLAGHPESFQLEEAGPRIFVNVPTANHIAVVDRSKLTVIATWPLVGVGANFPMALDEANHHLFIGCRQPPKIIVYDTESGKEVTRFDIAKDVDDIFYDSARKRLYASCGEGFLNVYQQNEADHYTALLRIPTAAGARTSLFVQEQGRLYLAVPQRREQQAEIRVYTVEP